MATGVVMVIINRSLKEAVMLNLNTGGFDYEHAAYCQSAGTNHFDPLGEVPASGLPVPVESIATALLDKSVDLGPAANPSPGRPLMPSTTTWALVFAVLFAPLPIGLLSH